MPQDRISRRQGGVHSRVAWDIAARIFEGRYPSGSTLPNEDQLSAEFSISRSALREALRRLSAIGFIEARPRTGTRVLSRESWNFLDPTVVDLQIRFGNTPCFLRNLMELRNAIEPTAAALAAEQSDYSKLALIAAAFGKMEEAAGDSAKFNIADIDFHRTIFLAADNELLWPIGRLVESALRAAFFAQATRETIQRTLPRHRKVLDAILGHDKAAASSEMSTLILESCLEIDDQSEMPIKPRI